MRSTPVATSLVVIAFVVLVAGCGRASDPVTPVACLDGPQVYRKALTGYPDDVRLPGGVKISDCLVRNQNVGDLTDVGDSLRIVATQLSRESGKPLGGKWQDVVPNYEPALGYLIGAAQLGAEDTDGIHATLIERIEAAATNNLDTSTSRKNYEQGVEAGKENG